MNNCSGLDSIPIFGLVCRSSFAVDLKERDKRLGEKSPRFPAFDYFCVLAIEHED